MTAHHEPEFRAGYEHGYGDGLVREYNDRLGLGKFDANFILIEESFDGLVILAQRLLDMHWPADVFDGSSGDPGPVFIAKLREGLAVLEAGSGRGGPT